MLFLTVSEQKSKVRLISEIYSRRTLALSVSLTHSFESLVKSGNSKIRISRKFRKPRKIFSELSSPEFLNIPYVSNENSERKHRRITLRGCEFSTWPCKHGFASRRISSWKFWGWKVLCCRWCWRS